MLSAQSDPSLTVLGMLHPLTLATLCALAQGASLRRDSARRAAC